MTKKKKADTAEEKKAKALYFLSLEVENVRCFGSKQTLDLSDGNGKPAQWTILLGENGTGKSTLLQCLAGIMCTQVDPPDRFILDLIEEAAGKSAGQEGNPVSERYRDHLIHVLVTQNLREQLYSRSFDWDRPVKIVALEAVTDSAGLTFSDLVVAGTTETGRRLPYVPPTETDVEYHARLVEYREEVRQNIKMVVAGYGPRRQPRDTALGDISNSAQRSAVSALNEGPDNLTNAEEWLLSADYAREKGGGDQVYSRIVETLIDLLPDVSDVSVVPIDERKSRFEVKFQTHYGWVPFNSLSHGYRTLVTWVVDFAAQLFKRFPDSVNPLAEPAICLVDEIDIHLHPAWQRTLIRFLTERFPKTQFIATAHSPLVVQAAEGANIALLKRVEDEVHIINDPEEIKGWRIDQILTSDLFGLPTARPPWMEGLMEQREVILAKPELTPEDEERLAALADEMGAMPGGETKEDMKAMRLIRQAAHRIENGEK